MEVRNIDKYTGSSERFDYCLGCRKGILLGKLLEYIG